MPPFVVRAEKDLGIPRTSKPVPSRTKLARNLAVVVDLSVVREPESAILGSHRLVSGRGEVEDRQAAVAENDGRIDEKPCVVRPTVTSASVISATRLSPETGSGSRSRVPAIPHTADQWRAANGSHGWLGASNDTSPAARYWSPVRSHSSSYVRARCIR